MRSLRTTTMLAALFITLTTCCRQRGAQTAPDTPTVEEMSIVDANAPTPSDESPEESVDDADRWVALHDRVIDLVERRVAFQIPEPEPQHSLVDATGLYIARQKAVSARSLPSGTERWSVDLSDPCHSLIQDAQNVYCVTTDEVRALRKDTGATRTLYSAGQTSIREASTVTDGVVVYTAQQSWELVDATSGRAWGHLPTLPGDRDSSVDPFILAPTRGDVFCLLARLETSYSLSCHRSAGPQIFSVNFPHTDVDVTGNTHYHHPVLHVRQVGMAHALFSSLGGPRHRAVVLRLDSGQRTASVDATVAAMVERFDGILVGLLTVDTERGGSFHYLDRHGSQRRWSLPNERGLGSAAVALVGDRLAIAPYSAIASGADLLCVDPADGRVLWRADVEQLNIEHSRYLNEVELRDRDDEVAMIGREAGGDYVQIFNASTGERLFSSLSRQW